MRVLKLLPSLVVLAVACAEYPKDDTLRLNHVQVKGTHNSYHVSAAPDFLPWAFTENPLAVQLADEGVRQVELDLNWDATLGHHAVFHVKEYDELSTCPTLAACLGPMREWSAANPWHVPVFVLLEFKDAIDGTDAQFTRLEDEILSVWPREAIVTPDALRGTHATLPEAIADGGWPTLGAVRGKAVFVLIGDQEIAKAYFHDGAAIAGKLLFGRGGPDVPWGAIDVQDTPSEDAAAIDAEVKAGYLVRTRADSDSEEAYRGDTRRAEAAIASGAHMISTDYPVQDPRFDYVFELREQRAATCNPVTAPADCRDDDVERKAAE